MLENFRVNVLKPSGAYLISGPKRGGLIREGFLTERGVGAYLKSYLFDGMCSLLFLTFAFKDSY